MKLQLSIIIPVYNEEKRIGKSLPKVLQFLKSLNTSHEVIVVDDGSTDKTLQIVGKFKDKIKIARVCPNRGKGFAVKTGMMIAEGEYLLFMDADLATPLSEINKILLTAQKSCDVVIGIRPSDSTVKRNFFRWFIGKIFHTLSHFLVPLNFKDTQCGFKLFNKKAALRIFPQTRIERLAFDIELLFLAKNLGLKVTEMPVKWNEKGGSRVKIIRDSARMLRDLVKIRFFALSNQYNFGNAELAKRKSNLIYANEIPSVFISNQNRKKSKEIR